MIAHACKCPHKVQAQRQKQRNVVVAWGQLCLGKPNNAMA